MKKVVIYGNCQATAIQHALMAQQSLAQDLTIIRHDLWLSGADLEASLPDYETADILFLQEVSNWAAHPMRERIPGSTKVVRFPFLLMSALWPYNHILLGKADPAYKHAPPEQPFLLMEPGLSLLRDEIPDPEARLKAYKQVKFLRRPVDIKRLALIEEARLLKADKDTGSRLGQFVVDSYRTERLYHTYSHPSGIVLRELAAEVLERAGLPRYEPDADFIDTQKHYQVPIHPNVIDALDLSWAAHDSTYSIFGEKLTFDEYCLRYIDAYG